MEKVPLFTFYNLPGYTNQGVFVAVVNRVFKGWRGKDVFAEKAGAEVPEKGD